MAALDKGRGGEEGRGEGRGSGRYVPCSGGCRSWEIFRVYLGGRLSSEERGSDIERDWQNFDMASDHFQPCVTSAT